MCPSPSPGWQEPGWDLCLPPEQLGTGRHWNRQFLHPACDPKFLSRVCFVFAQLVEVHSGLLWLLGKGSACILSTGIAEPSWTRNKGQAGFAKPVSENGSMECFGLGLLGTKEHQKGFEKLGQNPSAGQGVKENVEQREKWENRSGCKHKGIFFLCSDVHAPSSSGLHVPDGIVGIKAAGGSIWDLPAERDQRARALLLLTISLLSSSSLTWQLGRGEALEGEILMLRSGVWAVLRDSARSLCIPVFRSDGGVTAACLLQLGPLVALLSCGPSPCLPHPGDRGAPNSLKTVMQLHCQ